MDSQAQPPSKNPKRFFDIVPANKTVPDTTSRPIVVTNQSGQADPMVVASPDPHPATPAIAAVSLPTAPTQTAVPDTMPLLDPVKAPNLAVSAIESPEPTTDPGPPVAETPPPAPPPTEVPEHVDLHDMPLDLPPSAPPDVVVVHHGYSESTIRNVVMIVLILVMLAVIADLVLDIGLIKLALPHSHFFGS